MHRTTLLVLLVGSMLAVAACSEAPAAKPAPAAKAKSSAPKGGAAGTPAARSAAPPAPAMGGEPFNYQAAGRRDPFTNVLTSGTVEPVTAARRGEGVSGLLVNEIAVRGLVEMGGTRVAMVQGPDGRSYPVRPGDKLADGSVKSITPEGLVILQDVNDPLSTAKQREVRKLIRSVEEAKQ